jgi:6-phospho-3-hexuloisomerase
MDYTRAREVILEELRKAVGGVPGEQVRALVTLLRAAPAIFVTGEGRSGLIARCFAMRLVQLGMAAHVVGGTTTPALDPGDLLLAVSGSGETDLTRMVAQLASQEGGKVAILTGRGNSPLAAAADLAVVVDAEGSAQYGRSLFEQSALIVLDAIAMQLQQEIERTSEEMDARHANLE